MLLLVCLARALIVSMFCFNVNVKKQNNRKVVFYSKSGHTHVSKTLR